MFFYKNGFSNFSQLDFKLIWLPLVILALVNLLILHQHESNCQVKDKKRANPNADYEKRVYENAVVNVLVDVHYPGPAIHSGANEDG
jgi:hypothetical protein